MIINRPKSQAAYRVLQLAPWTVDMLRRRCKERRGSEMVFPAPLGGLRDPSNTASDLRELFDETGFEWVTSHVFRRTVATLMDRAGLSARAAADQLGRAHVSMTQNRYFGRRLATTGAADVLQNLVVDSAEESRTWG
ncbi:MAG TPA: tyrosine-type recombinase/integrase [Actinopolymorphaceae bacterium]